MKKPDGRVFLKPEWNRITDDWPCLSFAKRSVGERLRLEFVPGRDVLVYVGTGIPEFTKNLDYRSRLISVLSIEPKHVLETRKIVRPVIWNKSTEEFGERWNHSTAVLDAADMAGPPCPEARQVTPKATRTVRIVEH